ncbi:MAG: hypothetical protein N3E39_04375 [Candidatus Methanomethylicia archaeon]|nr:hypothetical protein [Candidatus Methanomethylicia archaeon]
MKEKFRCIADCLNFTIKIPVDCWFSFFNSPYPAHKSTTAIDIYYTCNEGLMPLDEGIVLEVKRFECPIKRIDASNIDYLILVKVSSGVVLKILHVKPTVKPGERIYLGDPLGKMIISGFFSPWSDLHMHLEVRDIRDPYRALGAFELDISKTVNSLINPIYNVDMLFYVEDVYRNYVWLKPSNIVNGFQCGLALMIDKNIFWVDGGIPHYGYGSILGFSGFGYVYSTFGDIVGSIYHYKFNYSIFKSSCIISTSPFNLKVIGIGSYIGMPFLKLILLDDGSKLKIGDSINICLTSNLLFNNVF